MKRITVTLTETEYTQLQSYIACQQEILIKNQIPGKITESAVCSNLLGGKIADVYITSHGLQSKEAK